MSQRRRRRGIWSSKSVVVWPPCFSCGRLYPVGKTCQRGGTRSLECATKSDAYSSADAAGFEVPVCTMAW